MLLLLTDCIHLLLFALLSGWNQQSAQAQLEKTLQVICQELQAEGVGLTAVTVVI